MSYQPFNPYTQTPQQLKEAIKSGAYAQQGQTESKYVPEGKAYNPPGLAQTEIKATTPTEVFGDVVKGGIREKYEDIKEDPKLSPVTAPIKFIGNYLKEQVPRVNTPQGLKESISMMGRTALEPVKGLTRMGLDAATGLTEAKLKTLKPVASLFDKITGFNTKDAIQAVDDKIDELQIAYQEKLKANKEVPFSEIGNIAGQFVLPYGGAEALTYKLLPQALKASPILAHAIAGASSDVALTSAILPAEKKENQTVQNYLTNILLGFGAEGLGALLGKLTQAGVRNLPDTITDVKSDVNSIVSAVTEQKKPGFQQIPFMGDEADDIERAIQESGLDLSTTDKIVDEADGLTGLDRLKQRRAEKVKTPQALKAEVQSKGNSLKLPSNEAGELYTPTTIRKAQELGELTEKEASDVLVEMQHQNKLLAEYSDLGDNELLEIIDRGGTDKNIALGALLNRTTDKAARFDLWKQIGIETNEGGKRAATGALFVNLPEARLDKINKLMSKQNVSLTKKQEADLYTLFERLKAQEDLLADALKGSDEALIRSVGKKRDKIVEEFYEKTFLPKHIIDSVSDTMKLGLMGVDTGVKNTIGNATWAATRALESLPNRIWDKLLSPFGLGGVDHQLRLSKGTIRTVREKALKNITGKEASIVGSDLLKEGRDVLKAGQSRNPRPLLAWKKLFSGDYPKSKNAVGRLNQKASLVWEGTFGAFIDKPVATMLGAIGDIPIALTTEREALKKILKSEYGLSGIELRKAMLNPPQAALDYATSRGARAVLMNETVANKGIKGLFSSMGDYASKKLGMDTIGRAIKALGGLVAPFTKWKFSALDESLSRSVPFYSGAKLIKSVSDMRSVARMSNQNSPSWKVMNYAAKENLHQSLTNTTTALAMWYYVFPSMKDYFTPGLETAQSPSELSKKYNQQSVKGASKGGELDVSAWVDSLLGDKAGIGNVLINLEDTIPLLYQGLNVYIRAQQSADKWYSIEESNKNVQTFIKEMAEQIGASTESAIKDTAFKDLADSIASAYGNNQEKLSMFLQQRLAAISSPFGMKELTKERRADAGIGKPLITTIPEAIKAQYQVSPTEDIKYTSFGEPRREEGFLDRVSPIRIRPEGKGRELDLFSKLGDFKTTPLTATKSMTIDSLPIELTPKLKNEYTRIRGEQDMALESLSKLEGRTTEKANRVLDKLREQSNKKAKAIFLKENKEEIKSLMATSEEEKNKLIDKEIENMEKFGIEPKGKEKLNLSRFKLDSSVYDTGVLKEKTIESTINKIKLPERKPNRTQCGEVTNDWLRLTGGERMGDTLASKTDGASFKRGGDPVVGGYFVQGGTKTGHCGVVTGITDEGIYITDSNKDNNGGLRENELIPYNSKEYESIIGFGGKELRKIDLSKFKTQ